MSNTNHPRQNHILAALPAADLERLLPELKRVALPLGMVLHDTGEVWEYVYFPTDSIVSLMYVTEDGESTEIAVTGCEGLVGIARGDQVQPWAYPCARSCEAGSLRMRMLCGGEKRIRSSAQ